LKTSQVNREQTKSDLRGLVDGYFRTDRPLILQELEDVSLLTELDERMQELLRLTQSRALKKRYITVLRDIEQEWHALERAGLPIAKPLIGLPQRTTRQDAILKSLGAVWPPGAKCFDQALRDLSDPARSSWRGTVAELREALRGLLDKLAPDEEVVKMPGFRLEDGAKSPTMKQKTRFVLRSRRRSESDRKPVEDAAQIVENNVGAFVRTAYTRSSVAVHTEPSRKDVISVLRFVELTVLELLELEA
jgi:hypothetical protein